MAQNIDTGEKIKKIDLYQPQIVSVFEFYPKMA